MNAKPEKLKTILKKMFSLKEDAASHEEIRDRLLSGGVITGTNMCVLICAMVIASVGLNVSSTAVIIGAMLISPLMGSILAMAYALVSNDFKLLRNHAVGFAVQIAISLVNDVLIATAGGVAGIIGQTRKGLFNTIIPGVAIATALMPPLCTCGYSIANGNWKMLSGAAYLFIVNAYFIFLASAVILSLLKTPKVRELTEKEWKRLRFRMIRNTIIILIPSLILGYIMLQG